MAKSLLSCLEDTARRYPQKVALYFRNEEITYNDLLKRIQATSTRLQEENLGKGSCIALLMANSPAFVISFFSALGAGAQVVLLNPLLKSEEVDFIFKDSEIKAAIADPAPAAEVNAIYRPGEVRIIDSEDIADCRPSGKSPAPVDPPGERVIIYTSATTGKPKGVVYTGEKLALMAERIPLPGDNVWLTALPLFHIFGLTAALLSPLIAGGTMALMERFQAAAAYELINRHGVTFFPLVPTMLGYLLAEAEPPEVPTLQVLIAGGAPLPEVMVSRWYEKYSGPLDPILLQGYGLTEGPPVATLNTMTFLKPGSVGQPLEGVEVRIVDNEGVPLPPGETGQIIISDRSLALGYLNQPEVSRSTYRNGWCQTGDLGYVDDDGDIFIVGRGKDMIIKGGYNIYPAEIEQVLMKNPKIREAAVVGVPDEVKGELVKAFIVYKEPVTPDEVLNYCRQRLAAYKIPNHIEFCESLPHGATGKVLKRLLK